LLPSRLKMSKQGSPGKRPAARRTRESQPVDRRDNHPNRNSVLQAQVSWQVILLFSLRALPTPGAHIFIPATSASCSGAVIGSPKSSACQIQGPSSTGAQVSVCRAPCICCPSRLGLGWDAGLAGCRIWVQRPHTAS
jgi:hypothetical protein